MYRTGRVGGRARLTRQGFHIQKTNKNSLAGSSDRSKRGVVPRVVKSSVDASRRGATTLDVLAFSSAIRGASTNAPLFRKTGVMRYDPLKKNVVRPFRALFSLVFGLVRGVVHSALAVATSPIRLLPRHRQDSRVEAETKTQNNTSIKTLQQPEASDDKDVVVSKGHDLVSHPILCTRQSLNQLQQESFTISRSFSRCESARSRNDSEITNVLKTYNTTESRDRLISKLKSMKSEATECVRSLSQRTPTTELSAPMSVRQLLTCKQEIVQLSRQISISTERPETNPRYRRCQSVVPGAVVSKDIESTLHTRRHSILDNAMSLKLQPLKTQVPAQSDLRSPATLAAPTTITTSTSCSIALTNAAKSVTSSNMTATKDTSSPLSTRTETLKMKLKRHESLVDSLKSRSAVKKILDGKAIRDQS